MLIDATKLFAAKRLYDAASRERPRGNLNSASRTGWSYEREVDLQRMKRTMADLASECRRAAA